MNKAVKRNLVFISHATPEDNEFTLWLSTRLKLQGYEVWSDVTKLFGGEKWWDDIDEAILQYTCKFILIVTKSSLSKLNNKDPQSKSGVQRELESALRTEKYNKLSNFVIPIIIDGTPYSPLPYDLENINIIQFRNKWSHGFSKLIERLTGDSVPIDSNVTSSLSPYLTYQFNPKTKLIHQEEPVTSNWLLLERIPDTLNFYRLPIAQEKYGNQFADYSYSWFEFGGYLVTFSSKDDINTFLPDWIQSTEAFRLTLSKLILDADNRLPAFTRFEFMRKINYMLLDSWNRRMRKLGLHCYRLSSGRESWFFSFNEPHVGRLKFPNVFGEIRSRAIMGFSKANNMYWHFAVEAKALYGPEAKICLIPHVVFTQDGSNPIGDKKLMHRLRRKFCMNWWNARWRDMLYAYLYQLSDEESFIALSVGKNSEICFSSRPITYTSPVKFQEIGDQTDDVDDELDDVVVEIGNEMETDDGF